MTEKIAMVTVAQYVPQWGSFISNGDPGACAYGAIPPERAEHRDTLVTYLRDVCLPIAREGSDEEGDEFEFSDVEMLEMCIETLKAIEYPLT